MVGAKIILHIFIYTLHWKEYSWTRSCRNFYLSKPKSSWNRSQKFVTEDLNIALTRDMPLFWKVQRPDHKTHPDLLVLLLEIEAESKVQMHPTWTDVSLKRRLHGVQWRGKSKASRALVARAGSCWGPSAQLPLILRLRVTLFGVLGCFGGRRRLDLIYLQSSWYLTGSGAVDGHFQRIPGLNFCIFSNRDWSRSVEFCQFTWCDCGLLTTRLFRKCDHFQCVIWSKNILYRNSAILSITEALEPSHEQIYNFR